MRDGWGGECCRRVEKERENKNLSRQEQASEHSVCPIEDLFRMRFYPHYFCFLLFKCNH